MSYTTYEDMNGLGFSLGSVFKSVTKAIQDTVTTAAPMLGGVAGSILFPGIGTAIGSVAGNLLGQAAGGTNILASAAGSALTPATPSTAAAAGTPSMKDQVASLLKLPLYQQYQLWMASSADVQKQAANYMTDQQKNTLKGYKQGQLDIANPPAVKTVTPLTYTDDKSFKAQIKAFEKLSLNDQYAKWADSDATAQAAANRLLTAAENQQMAGYGQAMDDGYVPAQGVTGPGVPAAAPSTVPASAVGSAAATTPGVSGSAGMMVLLGVAAVGMLLLMRRKG